MFKDVDGPHVCSVMAVEMSNSVVAGSIVQPVCESLALNCSDRVETVCVYVSVYQ